MLIPCCPLCRRAKERWYRKSSILHVFTAGGGTTIATSAKNASPAIFTIGLSGANVRPTFDSLGDPLSLLRARPFFIPATARPSGSRNRVHKTQKKRFPFIHNKLAQERDVEVEGGNLDSWAKESFARHGFKIIDLVRLGTSLLTTCRSAATNLLLRDRMVAKQLFARDGRTSAFISLEFSGEETCGEALYRLCHNWETAHRLVEPALFSNYLIQIELIGEQK